MVDLRRLQLLLLTWRYTPHFLGYMSFMTSDYMTGSDS